jgi:hypothetical protein
VNIHFAIVEGVISRVSTGDYRKRTGERKATKKGTQPPRTRDNLTGRGVGKAQRMGSILHAQRQFPGGKQYRRAMVRLEISNRFYEGLKGPKQVAFTKPGSMAL